LVDGALYSNHTHKVNVEWEVFPTDSLSEIRDQSMPAGAFVRPL
jgi:hypothetical protein